MSKGGSKQRFNTSPGLAASTNRLPPSTRARETAFCKEGFSKQLWALTCGVSGPSTFFPSIQPAIKVFGQVLRLTALPRLSTMQVRAGVLQVPPALVICHASIQQSGLTHGNGCQGTGSSMSPGGWGDGDGASSHHPGYRASTAVEEPCWCGGCCWSMPTAPRHVPSWQQLSATAGILMRAGQSPASLNLLSHQEL